MTYTASLYPDTYLSLTRPDDRLLDEAKSPGFGYLDRLICFSHFRLLSIWKNSCVVVHKNCGSGRLKTFGIGAFDLRHRPGEVPTISRKLRFKAGWSVNPTSNATVSKESFECNKRDFAASTRL